MRTVYTKKKQQLTRDIGRRIALLRKKAGFTQESLVQATRRVINFNTISVLERGLGDPKISTLYEIAQALDISLSELLDIHLVDLPKDTSRTQMEQHGYSVLKRLDEDSLKIAVCQLEAWDIRREK